MTLNGEVIAFLLLAICAISGAVLLIFFNKIIHALLSTVLTFLSIAGLYVLLSAEFIAGAQLLIYSGAVTILLLFAIMLTKNNDQAAPNGKPLFRLLALLGVLAFGLITYMGIKDIVGNSEATHLHVDNTEKIGVALYTKYIIPFELTSILLLAALIGAIVLAKREKEE